MSLFASGSSYSFQYNIRAVNKGLNPQHLLWLSMFDGSFMLRANLPVVDVHLTHNKSNKFITGVKIKATGESKLNDSPATLAVPDSMLAQQ